METTINALWLNLGRCCCQEAFLDAVFGLCKMNPAHMSDNLVNLYRDLVRGNLPAANPVEPQVRCRLTRYDFMEINGTVMSRRLDGTGQPTGKPLGDAGGLFEEIRTKLETAFGGVVPLDLEIWQMIGLSSIDNDYRNDLEREAGAGSAEFRAIVTTTAPFFQIDDTNLEKLRAAYRDAIFNELLGEVDMSSWRLVKDGFKVQACASGFTQTNLYPHARQREILALGSAALKQSLTAAEQLDQQIMDFVNDLDGGPALAQRSLEALREGKRMFESTLMPTP